MKAIKLDLSELLSLYPQMANIVMLSFWGKDGYPMGVAGYETDKLLIIDPKNY